MINFLNTAAQMVAAKSTISPDQKDLGAGTVASVVCTQTDQSGCGCMDPF